MKYIINFISITATTRDIYFTCEGKMEKLSMSQSLLLVRFYSFHIEILSKLSKYMRKLLSEIPFQNLALNPQQPLAEFKSIVVVATIVGRGSNATNPS